MGHTNVSSALFSYIHHTSTTQKPIFSPQSHEKHQDEQLHIKTEKTPQRAKEWANQRKTQHPQQKTIQKHNTERNNREIQEKNTTEKHNRKTQQRKIAENENRAYNNHIETGRTRKTILIFPVFALRDTKRYTDREIHTKEEKTSQGQRKWVNG